MFTSFRVWMRAWYSKPRYFVVIVHCSCQDPTSGWPWLRQFVNRLLRFAPIVNHIPKAFSRFFLRFRFKKVCRCFTYLCHKWIFINHKTDWTIKSTISFTIIFIWIPLLYSFFFFFSFLLFSPIFKRIHERNENLKFSIIINYSYSFHIVLRYCDQR